MLKSVLLYVGCYDHKNEQPYPEFSVDDIKILTNIGITEFVITDGGQGYNTYITDDGKVNHCVTHADVDTLDISVTERKLEYWHERFKNDYRERIERVSDEVSFNMFREKSLNCAKTVWQANPNAKVWFTFPGIEHYGLAEKFINPFKNELVDKLKAALTDDEWARVAGFYWSTECVVNDYTDFDYEDMEYNSTFNNPIVKAIKACSDHVRSYGKKMLWIPYYRHGDWSQGGKRLGYIANRTDFFDYMVLQPTYYFNEILGANIEAVRKGVEKQAVTDFYGQIFGGEKISKTAIGPEMEIEGNKAWKCIHEPGNEARYMAYVNAYKSFVDEVPIVYYAGNRDALMDPKIIDFIDKFYNKKD